MFWEHAANWVQMFGMSPDVTTFFHQVNSPSWGSQLRVNPETQEAEDSPADERSAEEVAEELVAVSLEEGALNDVDEMKKSWKWPAPYRRAHSGFTAE